jgi:hypothetical protein
MKAVPDCLGLSAPWDCVGRIECVCGERAVGRAKGEGASAGTGGERATEAGERQEERRQARSGKWTVGLTLYPCEEEDDDESECVVCVLFAGFSD